MRAGKLNRTITLQSQGVTRDEYGGEVETWTTQATVRAERLETPGREYVTGGANTTEAKAVYRIRYAASVVPTNGWRVVEGVATWDILSVTEIGLRAGLELHCERVT